MNYKIKLTIGEFSKLCYVTVKTLRHYEKLGLIIPHDVDEWTHYRYYHVSQMDEMIRIKKLKALGLSLDEIKEMQEDGRANPDSELVVRKIKETEDALSDLRLRLVALQSFTEQTTKTTTMSKITIKPLPGGTVASWRKLLNGYDVLGTNLVNTVMLEMQRLECICPEETAYCFTVDYNCNHDPNNIDLEYCEIVTSHSNEPSDILTFKDIPVVETAVCINHYGAYESFDEVMTHAFHYIEENGYIVTEQPRFCYIHGIWDCDNVADWLTEVQIPVKKA